MTKRTSRVCVSVTTAADAILQSVFGELRTIYGREAPTQQDLLCHALTLLKQALQANRLQTCAHLQGQRKKRLTGKDMSLTPLKTINYNGDKWHGQAKKARDKRLKLAPGLTLESLAQVADNDYYVSFDNQNKVSKGAPGAPETAETK